MMLDLVEIKLSCLDISDREDARDQQALERCRDELVAIDRGPTVAMHGPVRRPGRPRVGFDSARTPA